MQMANTPVPRSKFLHLKLLQISLVGMALSGAYDYLSLVSFLEASPRLETFILEVGYSHLASIPSVYCGTADVRILTFLCRYVSLAWSMSQFFGMPLN